MAAIFCCGDPGLTEFAEAVTVCFHDMLKGDDGVCALALCRASDVVTSQRS